MKPLITSSYSYSSLQALRHLFMVLTTPGVLLALLRLEDTQLVDGHLLLLCLGLAHLFCPHTTSTTHRCNPARGIVSISTAGVGVGASLGFLPLLLKQAVTEARHFQRLYLSP